MQSRGESVDIQLEDVFEVAGRGHFALLRVDEKGPLRDGLQARLDGCSVIVSDIAPRVLDVLGQPRTDVVVVSFMQPIDVERWRKRTEANLVLDIA